MEIVFEFPTVGVVPKVELKRQASGVESELDAGKIRLFTDALPTIDNTLVLADYVAHEATFSGYPAGGIAIPGPDEPYWDGVAEGYKVVIPAVQFNRGVGAVSNNIAGFIVVPDGGDVYRAVTFEEPIPMETVDDSIPITIVLVFKA